MTTAISHRNKTATDINRDTFISLNLSAFV